MVASDGCSGWFSRRAGAQTGLNWMLFREGQGGKWEKQLPGFGGDALFPHKAVVRHGEQGRESRAERIV